MLVGGDEPDDIRVLAARDPSVRLLGYVPEIASFLRRFAIMAYPMRLVGGTRLKFLEALGAGMACVSSSIGAEGVEARDGYHYLMADDPASFTEAVERILNDPGLRRSLGQRGRELVRDRYTWRAVTRELVAFYQT
jgi:glycosyltransferase involved in cell wall biosynthesis